ncbi:5371_t:CDS:2, partial [Ambispora leptoticha]
AFVKELNAQGHYPSMKQISSTISKKWKEEPEWVKAQYSIISYDANKLLKEMINESSDNNSMHDDELNTGGEDDLPIRRLQEFNDTQIDNFGFSVFPVSELYSQIFETNLHEINNQISDPSTIMDPNNYSFFNYSQAISAFITESQNDRNFTDSDHYHFNEPEAEPGWLSFGSPASGMNIRVAVMVTRIDQPVGQPVNQTVAII